MVSVNMYMKGCKSMKEWLAIQGEFKNEGKEIQFIGGNLSYTDIQTDEKKDGSKYSILMFND